MIECKTKHCEFCNRDIYRSWFERHINVCKFKPENKKLCINPLCNKEFYPRWNDKEYTQTTCSVKCSNTMFRSGINNGNWHDGKYRTTCFHYHNKECIICGENKLVEVHHYNENHDDNRPENLVPMCPTHHQYMHSRYKNELQDKVAAYVRDFIKKE